MKKEIMRKYGIWNVVILKNDSEVEKCDITATSGKDAKYRAIKFFPGCEVLKITRKLWLTGLSFSQLAAVLMGFNSEYADALLTILSDCGVFSESVEKSSEND